MENKKDGSEYQIDLNSTESQKMSDVLTTHAVLQETVYGWLKGTTMFFSLTDMKNLTYADVAEHIGNDANEYRFNSMFESREYVWYASDKQYARFLASFRKNAEDEWVIHATGSTQIAMPDSYLEYLNNK